MGAGRGRAAEGPPECPSPSPPKDSPSPNVSSFYWQAGAREVALLTRRWKYDGTEWIGYAFGVLFAFILFFGAPSWQQVIRLPGAAAGSVISATDRSRRAQGIADS